VSELDAELTAELTEIFREEATTRLDRMDEALLALESGDAGGETIDSLFRNAHTIKGSAGMLGFDDIRSLGHAVEDILAGVREAGVFPPELAGPLLRATAALRAQVAGSEDPIDGLIDDLAAIRVTHPNGDARIPVASAPESAVAAPGVAVPGVREPGVYEPGLHEPGPPEPGLPEPPEPSPAEPGVREPGVAGPGVREPGVAGPGVREPGVREAPEPSPAELSLPAPGLSEPGVSKPGRAGPSQPAPSRAERRTLRVPAEKIDHLLDVVGEVMQQRRRLTHSLTEEAPLSQDIAEVLSVGDRMLNELKDMAVGLRTLPLASITGPFPRAVRDYAHAAGKSVDFVVTGPDTELDRVILESLSEPLGHLLRNAVNHGIESPQERERVGKPPRGRVEVRAVPRGSLVEIVVADDGRGVSPEVIDEVGREGSLVDVLARAGYSTAEEVTDLAGRGVGLDAVKIYAQSLGGSLEVRSEPGRGMEIVLLLPLALALLEVLLFERGGAVYGVPLAAVEEVVTLTGTFTLEGRPALEVRGRPLPVADFAALVGARAPPLGDLPPALVISAGGRRTVATCDALRGEEEVVVKPLGPIFGGVDGYLGAAILGDGRIALLVEPTMLTRGRRRVTGTAPPAAAPAVAPKILVVEDSFTVRELQRSILEAAGYPVVTARDGREALAALDRDPQIALVLTDFEMPELDGLELTRAIRADAARSSLPIIVVTSRGSEDDQRRGIEAGADAYMVKQSFDQQALLATVERLVGR
jgi:chemotaxis protein histidine kinase CheA